MAVSVIVDDTSLGLMALIVVALILSLYLRSTATPLLHPLILSRQSDIASIRRKGESAVFRNANAPAGFDLAARPRKGAVDVAALVRLGAGGSDAVSPAEAATTQRSVYGQRRSNVDIAREAAILAEALKAKVGGAGPVTLAVCAETDSLPALEAILSASFQDAASSSRLSTLVIAPTYLSSADGPAPGQLPEVLGSAPLSAIFTTSTVVSKLGALGGLIGSTTMLVFPTKADEAKAAASIKGQQTTSIEALLSHPGLGDSQTASQQDAEAAAKAIAAHYWLGEGGWCEVSHGSLTAGVTSHMGLYPSELVPSLTDSILIEQSPFVASPSLRLGATASPAGLTLAVMALYTGAAISADVLTSTLEDPHPAPSKTLKDVSPTFIYASPKGAAALGAALSTLAERSPIAAIATRSKLSALRSGTMTRGGFWDSLLFSNVRESSGTADVRSIVVLGEGAGVSQRVLDALRTCLSVPVLNAYLPAGPLRGATSGKLAAVTAPVTSAHAYDLQAFASEAGQRAKAAAHVGPPNVSVEVKLVESDKAREAGFTVTGSSAKGREGNPHGEIYVRGTTLAGVTTDEWVATGDLGELRTNGTLVVVRDVAGSVPMGLPRGPTRGGVNATSSSRGPRSFAALSVFGMALVSLLISPVLAQGSVVEHPLMSLSRRASSDPNSTYVSTARLGMLLAQRASWEQGVAQSAILELEAGEWSVFAGGEGPPYRPSGSSPGKNAPMTYLTMAYRSVVAQGNNGMLCFRVTGDENVNSSSALDPAACGEGVLIAAFANGEVSNGRVQRSDFWLNSASRMLNYVLNVAPRVTTGPAAGAISHRASGVALWSDANYMAPPFLASYGLLTSNQTLLQAAYDQLRLYREGIRITSGPATGLFSHIVSFDNRTAGSNDPGAWATGNGWSAAGMLRVAASIAQSSFSDAMRSQKEDIMSWTNEILTAAFAFNENTDSPLVRNYIDDTDTFLDAAGSTLLAYAAFRYASMTGDRTHIDRAQSIYDAVTGSLSGQATYLGIESVDALGFTTAGFTSSESLAFGMLLSAARRDYQAGNVTGIDGPSRGFKAGAASLRPVAGLATLGLVAGAAALVL